MKKVLVTGGTGFIGNCFCKLLLKERPGVKVVNVDSLTYAANPSTMKEELKNPNYKFYKEDIRNREGIFKIFEEERPDVVVNFAAESHVDRSIENPGIFLETNILGTQVLMDAARKYGVERFHQVGTDEVYGPSTPCVPSSGGTSRASSPRSPRSPPPSGCSIPTRTST